MVGCGGYFSRNLQVTRDEKRQWPKQVDIFFNETATVNEDFMLHKYLPLVQREMRPGLLVYDSCNAHLTEGVKKAFKEGGITLAVIPKVCIGGGVN